jgi:hypothetical protein
LQGIIDFIDILEINLKDKEDEIDKFISPNMIHNKFGKDDIVKKIDRNRPQNFILNEVGCIVDEVYQLDQQKEQQLHQKDQEIKQMDHEIKEKYQEVQQKNYEIQEKNNEINMIKSSKFWKLRGIYMKIKK